MTPEIQRDPKAARPFVNTAMSSVAGEGGNCTSGNSSGGPGSCGGCNACGASQGGAVEMPKTPQK